VIWTKRYSLSFCPQKACLSTYPGCSQGQKKAAKKANPGPKKKAAIESRVIISRVQRQKRKFITVIVGLDTVPDLKLKDAVKLFGKKFSSGSSLSESATGAKEIVIQGDVGFELAPLIISEFKVTY
jgi:density-regulated protein DRP1